MPTPTTTTSNVPPCEQCGRSDFRDMRHRGQHMYHVHGVHGASYKTKPSGATTAHNDVAARGMTFCPVCGVNLEVIAAAISIAQRTKP